MALRPPYHSESKEVYIDVAKIAINSTDEIMYTRNGGNIC